MPGLIFDIQRYAIYDGPGIRSAVFLKGCPLRCRWCHNPESQRAEPETSLAPDGKFIVTIGRRVTAAEVVAEVMPDKPFYDESGGGVTLSGGEPLFQPDFALELLGALHAQGLHTAVETSGFFPADLIEPLARVCDLFLFDLKHIDPAKHREGAGADNRLILENFPRLLDLVGGERVIARVPLIPGFNADEGSVAAIAEFLKRADYAGPVHLLPFHAWARDKYRRLRREWPYHGVAGVGDDMMIQVLAAIEARGFKHQLYG